MKAIRPQDQEALDAEDPRDSLLTIALMWHVPPWLISKDCSTRDRVGWKFRYLVWAWWKVRY